MTKQLQIFENEEFGKIRTLERDGQPWFVGKDVAKALGYSNFSKAVTSHVDSEDRLTQMIPTAQNGKLVSRTYIINESGLYSLILSSKLPTAKRFKRWVTSEVLPTIRKHGAYITDAVLEEAVNSQEFAFELFKKLQSEKGKNAALLDKMEALAPKARYCDLILQCKDVIPVSLIAKDYGMSGVAFNKLLHALGIQYKIGTTWLIYQRFANRGYTYSKTYITPSGCGIFHTCWTQKGRLFLYETLCTAGIYPIAERNFQEVWA